MQENIACFRVSFDKNICTVIANRDKKRQTQCKNETFVILDSN